MESKNKHCLIAISYVVALLIVTFSATAFAADAAGIVTYLNGPLLDHKLDGSMKTLAKDSIFEQGDTLITGKRTYARIKFSDESEITLRPDSQFKVEAYSYDQAKPKEDKAVFALVKGGLRALTGQVGKRGDPNSYKMKVPSATIGIRGTIFELFICARECEGSLCTSNCIGLSGGDYFFVPEGSITVTNDVGHLIVSEGHYAFAKDVKTPPVLLPAKPGLEFVLPEDVQKTGRSGAGGCIVR